MQILLPSYKYLLLTTSLASIFSCWGLVYEDSTSLLVATILASTSSFLYESIRSYSTNGKISLKYIIICLLITILLPLSIGALMGYMFILIPEKGEHSIFKYTEYEIPNRTMDFMIKPDFLNILFSTITPFIVAMFIPYADKKNNIILQIAISIALSFVTPLTIIGLFTGSNNYTDKTYDINNYYIPIIKFLANFFAIILSAVFNFTNFKID